MKNYEDRAKNSVTNRLPKFYPSYILKYFTALEWLTIPVSFVQIAFQLTELFQTEIDAVIYTDQFTCLDLIHPLHPKRLIRACILCHPLMQSTVSAVYPLLLRP